MLPKDIDKRMKASGLKKLRFYCQVCEKQCGNDVGFKRHCESESHLRRMMVFRENPMELMEEYSRTMEKEYLNILRRYGTKQVDANQVYQVSTPPSYVSRFSLSRVDLTHNISDMSPQRNTSPTASTCT